MTSNYFSGGCGAARAVATAFIACALVAGCGGGGGSGVQWPVIAPSTPAPNGDGATPPAVPVTQAPAPGAGESGADVPTTTSKLDCAP